MKYLLVAIYVFLYTKEVCCSTGDKSQYFQNCRKICINKNCTTGGYDYVVQLPNDFVTQITSWSCNDECQYECMWKTTNLFLERNWPVPQFYGKWPFIRVWGIQEPASTLFSCMNWWAHFLMIRKFRKEIRSDTPMFYVWHIFAGICLNAWTFSSLFHIRDFPVTELFDYTFAYSIILAFTCCTLIRMVYHRSNYLKGIITCASTFYFLRHFAYLSVGKFDYQYNMKANILTGFCSTLIWIIWYLLNRRKKLYSKKILVFNILAGVFLLLEVLDFPPLFWIFDAHSIWHLSTVPLTNLLYSFLIDDCKSLRNEKLKVEKNNEKKKLI